MKKSLLCLALAITAMLGVNAYAADADYNEGTVAVTNASDVHTVLIKKGNEVYYVNQAEKGTTFDSALNFVMKANDLGTYTLTLGHNDVGESEKATTTVDFAITASDLTPDVVLGALATDDNGNGTFDASFVTEEAIKLTDYKWLTVKVTDKTMGYSVENLGTQVTGNAEVMLGIQINNIPDTYKDNVEVGFTAENLQVEGGNN